MLKLRQAIVVEGRYDKNALRQLVDAPVFDDRWLRRHARPGQAVALLRSVAQKRGLIILTDPDGAGFVIRNYLKGALPKQGGAVTPTCRTSPARSGASARPGKEGKLGVEGMRPEVLLPGTATRRASRWRTQIRRRMPRTEIAKADLFAAGLSGRHRQRRSAGPHLKQAAAAAGASERQCAAGRAERPV